MEHEFVEKLAQIISRLNLVRLTSGSGERHLQPFDPDLIFRLWCDPPSRLAAEAGAQRTHEIARIWLGARVLCPEDHQASLPVVPVDLLLSVNAGLRGDLWVEICWRRGDQLIMLHLIQIELVS